MDQADKIAQELRLRHLDVMERITQINLSAEKFEDVLSKLLEFRLRHKDGHYPMTGCYAKRSS